MSTIFPREEKAEQIFDEILKNPHACERLKDTFFEAIPSAEESEGAGTDIPGTVFAAALFTAYENKDLSAFMMAVCKIPYFLRTKMEICCLGHISMPVRKNTKCFISCMSSRMRYRIIICTWRTDFGKNMVIMRRGRLRHSEFQNTQEFLCFLNFRNLLHWRLTKRDLMPLYGNI